MTNNHLTVHPMFTSIEEKIYDVRREHITSIGSIRVYPLGNTIFEPAFAVKLTREELEELTGIFNWLKWK